MAVKKKLLTSKKLKVVDKAYKKLTYAKDALGVVTKRGAIKFGAKYTKDKTGYFKKEAKKRGIKY